MCGGRGTTYVDMSGRHVEYFDDLCDLVACEECNGSGIEHECDDCHDQREDEEDSLYG